MGKELSTEIPKGSHELSAELKKAGIDLPSEKLKLRSSAKDQYLGKNATLCDLQLY